MWKVLGIFKTRLIAIIPFFMAAGLFAGHLTEVQSLKQLILPLTMMMVFPMMAGLPFRSLFSSCSGRLLGAVFLVNFIILPGAGFLLGRLFFSDPVYRLGILIVALIPTSGMTISWTAFAGGNRNAAVRLSLISMILAAVLLPLYTTFFLGRSVPIDTGKIFFQIGLVLLLPLFAGFVFQKFFLQWKGAEYFQQSVKPKLPLLSTAALLLIIFSAMALKSKVILQNPVGLLILLPPILIFYLFTFLFATFLARRLLPVSEGVALVYSTGLRNLSLALGIALTAFGRAGFGAAILITVAYLVQIQGAAWYHRFVISGKIRPGKKMVS